MSQKQCRTFFPSPALILAGPHSFCIFDIWPICSLLQPSEFFLYVSGRWGRNGSGLGENGKGGGEEWDSLKLCVLLTTAARECKVNNSEPSTLLSTLPFKDTTGSGDGKPSPPPQGLKRRGSSLLHETLEGNLKHNHPPMLLHRDTRSDVAPVGLAGNKLITPLFIAISNWSCAFWLGEKYQWEAHVGNFILALLKICLWLPKCTNERF